MTVLGIVVEYETVSRSGYVRLRSTEIESTVSVSDGLMIDLDRHNQVVGIEILNTDESDVAMRALEAWALWSATV